MDNITFSQGKLNGPERKSLIQAVQTQMQQASLQIFRRFPKWSSLFELLRHPLFIPMTGNAKMDDPGSRMLEYKESV